MLEVIAHVFMAFLAIITVLVVYLAITSVYVLKPDKMLVSFYLARYLGTYLPSGSYERRRVAGGLPTDAKKGYIPFFRDIIILPWPLWHGIYLPMTNVVLRYHGARIYTKDDVPVNINGTIVLRLDASLAHFIEAFNVFGRGRDLAREETVKYLYDQNPVTGERVVVDYQGPCLTQIILDDTTNQFQETLRHVASLYTWKALVGDVRGAEAKIRYYLAAPESPFAEGDLLFRAQEYDPSDPAMDAEPGPAIRGDAFDLNLYDIVSSDENFMNALAKPRTAALEAKANKISGIGEGNRIHETATRAGITGRELVRNETVREVDEMTVVAAGETFSAVIGGLLAGRRGGPRTGTRQRRGNQPPQQTPPQNP